MEEENITKETKKKWYKRWWAVILWIVLGFKILPSILHFLPLVISGVLLYFIIKKIKNPQIKTVVLVISIIIGFFWILSFASQGSKKQETSTQQKEESEAKQSPQPTKTEEQIQKEKEFEEEKREEERKANLAKQYCDKRVKSSRYYPIPEIETGDDAKKEYKLNDNLKKIGLNLTQMDCKNIIDYLANFATKYATVVSVDIESVVERKYWIGMSAFELWSSLGYPNKINTTNYGSGETEQYVYYKDSYGASASYIYLEHSKVTSYQDF